MIPFAYSHRNLRVRWKTTLMTASGFTLVVALGDHAGVCQWNAGGVPCRASPRTCWSSAVAMPTKSSAGSTAARCLRSKTIQELLTDPRGICFPAAKFSVRSTNGTIYIRSSGRGIEPIALEVRFARQDRRRTDAPAGRGEITPGVRP